MTAAGLGVLLAGCAGAPAVGGGTVRGRVTYAGPRPAKTTIYVADHDRHVDAHVGHVDEATSGLRDVAVYLRGVSAPANGEKPAGEPPLIDQVDAVFVPHVSAVRAGRPVRFRSSDSGNHIVHAVSFTEANQFNTYFHEGRVYDHTFERTAQDRPVLLRCGLHDWMTAWLYVFDHPYYAVTSADGSFAITDVPPGQYTLVAHHADAALQFEQPITIAPSATHEVTLTLHGKPNPVGRARLLPSRGTLGG